MKIEIGVKLNKSGEYKVVSQLLDIKPEGWGTVPLPLSHTCPNWELACAYIEGYCNMMADVKGMHIVVEF